jgi:hypothetical protein
MKIAQFAVAFILTAAIAVPTHAVSINVGENTALSKGLNKSIDPLDEVIEQSKKLKSRLDYIRNNSRTTTAKKRELLAKLSPLWQANIKNFLDVLKLKNATEEDIAYTKERLINYADRAFVCNDSNSNMCAESVPQ